MNYPLGVDVSHFQGAINFTELMKSANFTIIKCDEGMPNPGQTAAEYQDPNYLNNRSAGESAGMSLGFYHFAYPNVAGNTAAGEAACFCENIGTLKAGQFVALDFEEPAANPVAWALTWLQEVENKLGVKPLIYLNKSLTANYDWTPVINGGYGLWLADYTYNPDAPMFVGTQWPVVAIGQYSDAGNVAGINANIDLDVFYGTMDELIKYGYQPPVVTPPTPPVDPTPPVPPTTPPVSPTPPVNPINPLPPTPPTSVPVGPVSNPILPTAPTKHLSLLVQLLKEFNNSVEAILEKIKEDL